MKIIEIEQRHGYLIDANGLVVERFGNWETGTKKVSDAVESVEYVNGPATHDKKIADKYRGGA